MKKQLTTLFVIFLLTNHGYSLEGSNLSSDNLDRPQKRFLEKEETPAERYIRTRWEEIEAKAKALQKASEVESSSSVPDGGSIDRPASVSVTKDSLPSPPRMLGAVTMANARTVGQDASKALKGLSDATKIWQGTRKTTDAITTSFRIISGVGMGLGILGGILGLFTAFFPQEAEYKIVLEAIDRLDLKLSIKLDRLDKRMAYNDAKFSLMLLEQNVAYANSAFQKYLKALNDPNSLVTTRQGLKDLYMQQIPAIQNAFLILEDALDLDGTNNLRFFSQNLWTAASEFREGAADDIQNLMIGISLLATRAFTHLAFFYHAQGNPFIVDILQADFDALQNKLVTEYPKIIDIRKKSAADYIKSETLRQTVSNCDKFKTDKKDAKQVCAQRLYDDLSTKYYDLYYTMVMCYNQLNGFENNSRRMRPNGAMFCHENVGDRKCCIILQPRECVFNPQNPANAAKLADTLGQLERNLIYTTKKKDQQAETILGNLDSSFQPLMLARNLYVGFQTDIPYYEISVGPSWLDVAIRPAFGGMMRPSPWTGISGVVRAC